MAIPQPNYGGTGEVNQNLESMIFGGESAEEEERRLERGLATDSAYWGAEKASDSQYQGVIGPALDQVAYWERQVSDARARPVNKYMSREQALAHWEEGRRAVPSLKRPSEEQLQETDRLYREEQARLDTQYQADNELANKKLAEARSRLEEYTPDQLNLQQQGKPELIDGASYDPATYGVSRYAPTKLDTTTEFGLKDSYDIGIPEYEKAALQGPSGAAMATADARGLSSQRAALGELENTYKQGGMTALDRARYEQQKGLIQQEERAQREAILSNMDKRGMGAGSYQLQALLANQQGSSSRLNQAGVEIEGLALARRDQAIRDAMAGGRTLADDVYTRQFNTGYEADKVDRFNTEGFRTVQQDTRNAQNAFAASEADRLARDAAAKRNADEYNATNQTNADAWIADKSTAANRDNSAAFNDARKFGAESGYNASVYNANALTNQNINNTNIANTGISTDYNKAWENIDTWNQEQRDKADQILRKGGAKDAILTGTPTSNYAAGAGKLIETGAAIAKMVA